MTSSLDSPSLFPFPDHVLDYFYILLFLGPILTLFSCFLTLCSALSLLIYTESLESLYIMGTEEKIKAVREQGRRKGICVGQ